MNISSFKITRHFPDEKKEEKEILLLKEHRLLIKVNRMNWASLVCTDSNLLELVAGHLLSSGLIESKDEIQDIRFCETKETAFVLLKTSPDFIQTENQVSSCCSANSHFAKAINLSPLKKIKSHVYEDKWIFSLAEEFAKGSALHTHTSGTHSCILAKEGKILFACEDIGRHCALDKVLGYMLLHDYEPCEMCIFTSGRVPLDMVEKVIRCGVGVLVSKSVPTSESLSLSKEYGLTLIFRAWKDSFESLS